VDLRSLKRGDEVTDGYVYRRIPNFESHYNYEASRPEPAAFVPRFRDEGFLSGHLDEAEARAALADPRLKGFGLCKLDIDVMRRESAGRIQVIFAPWKESRSHVRIAGCTQEEVPMLLADIAEIVEEPGQPREPR
jgi:hypothetical protein